MEIILKQDILNLGFASDLVIVKDGYARNYLIPQGFAVMASSSNKKINAENLKQKTNKEDKVKLEASTLAKALETIKVRIGAKAAESGKIYGSVNALQIAEAIKEQFNYDVDRKKIRIDGEAIKELGEYKAKIVLHKEIQAIINFEVFAE